MISHFALRVILVFAAAFNSFAALALVFPESLQAFAGIPATQPRFPAWMLAMLIGLFDGVYARLAIGPRINAG
jgi:MFS-type transporter involved in bile tolerance (Atg22 family)